MTISALIGVLTRYGVTLTSRDGHLDIDAPSDVVGAETLQIITRHKNQILAALVAGDGDTNSISLDVKTFVSPSPPNATEANDIEIDPVDLIPCPTCGTLEAWQTAAGTWRCERCDPPSDRAMEFLEAAERIRREHRP